MEYPNVTRLIGAVLSTGMVTMTELGTTLSIEDCYDVLEVAFVNAENRRRLDQVG